MEPHQPPGPPAEPAAAAATVAPQLSPRTQPQRSPRATTTTTTTVIRHAPLQRQHQRPAVITSQQGAPQRDKSTRVHDWEFRSHSGVILDSKLTDEWHAKLDVFSLPEMVFGDSVLEIRHIPTGFQLHFDAYSALVKSKELLRQQRQEKLERSNSSLSSLSSSSSSSSLDASQQQQPSDDMYSFPRRISVPEVKVSAARSWKINKIIPKDIEQRDDSIDWTFSTTYTGTIRAPDYACKVLHATFDQINYELLKRNDPILFYDELTLYEDELHDNGLASLKLKMRVMPTCFFLLLRYWLRVDDVVLRIIDTRWFHEFDKPNVLLREFTYKEESIPELKKTISDPLFFTDPNQFQNALREIEKFTDRIEINAVSPPAAPPAAPADAAQSPEPQQQS